MNSIFIRNEVLQRNHPLSIVVIITSDELFVLIYKKIFISDIDKYHLLKSLLTF
jgi:hypothetical protein